MVDSSLSPLPFFFRKIDELNQYILTNQSGAYVFIDNKDELENIILGGANELSYERKEELIAKSFIANDSEYSIRASLVASKFASLLKGNIVAPSLFLVVPTLRCDHNCHYCQVSRVPTTKQGYDLKRNSISKILEIIRAIPNDEIKIEFQGGEPLLAFPYIQEFIDLSDKILSDRKVEYVVCSALGPVNDAILKWAKEKEVIFSTSLDGPSEIHDTNRPANNFKPYQNTVEQIKNIQSILGPNKLGCLSTITKQSLNKASAITEEYFNQGLEGVFLRPLSPFGFATQTWKNIGYSAEEYFEFYKSALDYVIDLNDKRYFVEENALIHLRKIYRPAITGFTDLKSPSGYLMGAMVFNYDGNIFGSDEARMLWESTKADELVLGNIDTNISNILSNKNAIELLSDTLICASPGCDECAYQPFCGADPLFHLATQGDHVGDKSQSFFCKLERLTFDHLFSLYQTSVKARRVFDQWLAL